jgi:hypothetical protein
MTPKEKAEELYNKYFLLQENATDEKDNLFIIALNKGLAKKCALIAVDEVLKEEFFWLQEVGAKKSESEWQQVKQEIEKL